MFAKLLKHEMRAVGRTILILSIAALVASGIGALLLQLTINNLTQNSSELSSILYALIIFGIYLGLIAYTIGSVILLYYRFYKSKFTDEGYLTFTLPVSTHQILLSSIVSIWIWTAIIYCVLFSSLIILLIPVIVLAGQTGAVNDIQILFSNSGSLDIYPQGGQLALVMLGSLIYSTILPLFSLTVGSLLAKKHKILVSFLIGYGISICVYSINSFVSITNIITDAAAGAALDMSNSYTIPSCIMLLLGVGGYFVMHHLIDKKLNI